MATSQSEQPAVAIVTTEGCPYCRQAKSALTTAGIPYTEYQLTNQVEILQQVKAASGQATVPQIFVGGQLVGGASEVAAGLKDGSFTRRVEEASTSPLPPAIQNALAEFLEQQHHASDNSNFSSSDTASKKDTADLRLLAASMQKSGFGGSPGAIFNSSKALKWLQMENQATPEAAASTLGTLQAANILTLGPDIGLQDLDVDLTSVSNSGKDVILRWVGDCPLGTSLKEPLNVHYAWFGPPRSAVEVRYIYRYIPRVTLKLQFK